MSNTVILEDITYVNTNKGEVTDRTIVRIQPAENVTVIDVTGLSELDQQVMVNLYQEYLDWRDVAAKAIPSFESWADQQANVAVDPAWKSLKRTHIINR